jgi:diguanylate cyclase (GGDEF)-like protein
MDIISNIKLRQRLLVLALISSIPGIVVFILLGYITNDRHLAARTIISVLASLLLFSSALSIVFLYLYKESNSFINELRSRFSKDKLYELYNQSSAGRILDTEIAAAKEKSRPVSIIMLDLDHFSEINGSYGQTVGNHILSIFGLTVLKCIRTTDILTHFRGDEMIVILPETDLEAAKALSERICSEVSNTSIPPIDGVTISSIHCSAGVSEYPSCCEDGNTLISTADLALFLSERFSRTAAKYTVKIEYIK